MKKFFKVLPILVICVIAGFLTTSCGSDTSALEEKISNLQAENIALKKENSGCGDVTSQLKGENEKLSEKIEGMEEEIAAIDSKLDLAFPISIPGMKASEVFHIYDMAHRYPEYLPVVPGWWSADLHNYKTQILGFSSDPEILWSVYKSNQTMIKFFVNKKPGIKRYLGSLQTRLTYSNPGLEKKFDNFFKKTDGDDWYVIGRKFEESEDFSNMSYQEFSDAYQTYLWKKRRNDEGILSTIIKILDDVL